MGKTGDSSVKFSTCQAFSTKMTNGIYLFICLPGERRQSNSDIKEYWIFVQQLMDSAKGKLYQVFHPLSGTQSNCSKAACSLIMRHVLQRNVSVLVDS